MNLSKLIIFFLTLTLWSASLVHGQQMNAFRIKKVVIDAGHGGKDPGAVFGGFKEKDIALSVALKLGSLVNREYPDVEVIYTRKTDVFIPLYERSDIANKANADLFISVHVNAAKSRSATGTETLVMGLEKSEDNLDVAMVENSVITYEEDYQTKYEGYDPASAESFIIFSLMQYSFVEQSLNLASLVQKHYGTKTQNPNRGVKQRGVIVLWRTSMPSILTELGFISNENDRRQLTSENGQGQLATAIFNAFSEYKATAEKRSAIIIETPKEWGANNTEQATATTGASATGGNATAATNSGAAATNSATTNKTTSKPVEKTATTAKTESLEGDIRFSIQIKTSSKKLNTSSSADFNVYRGQAIERKMGNTYKYYLLNTKSYQEVLSLLPKVKRRFADAFVVAFNGTQPIELKKALTLTDQQ